MSTDLNKIMATQAVQGEKIESIEETCKEIKTCLLGNGQAGLVLRTDRLEQKDAFKTKLFWVLIAIISGLIFEAILPAIFRHLN